MKKLELKSVSTVDRTFTFEETLLDENGEVKFTGTREVTLAQGENLDVELRKLCDNDIEIFIDGQSIGTGALAKGAGMTEEELKKDSENGPQDIGPNGSDNVGDPNVNDGKLE